MAITTDLKTAIATATLDECNTIVELIRARRGMLAIDAGASFAIGSRVKFDAGARGIIRGALIKRNAKSVKVQADGGVTWKVTPYLLEADTAPVAAKTP